MTIKMRCEHCHKTVEAPDSAGGRRGKCPYCGQSTYIPLPVGDDDVLPLAPVDEDEERQRQAEAEALLRAERDLLTDGGGGGEAGVPLEYRDDLTSDDLHHYVVNYCMDMVNSRLERAEVQVRQLKKFGYTGAEAVNDFLNGKAHEQTLDMIPKKVLKGFLTQLRDQLKK